MTTVNDDFNRTNENPLAGNWETISGDGVQLSSNKVVGRGGTYADLAAYKSSATAFAADQSSTVQLTALGNFDHAAVCVRCSAASSGSGYALFYRHGAGYLDLYKVSGGTATGLSVPLATGLSLSANHYIRLSVATSGGNAVLQAFTSSDGSSWTQRGSDYTDSSSPISSGQPGIGYSFQDSNLTFIDNWTGADNAASGTGVVSIKGNRGPRVAFGSARVGF